MSMKEEWRSVSTRCGEPFAVGQVTAAGEFQMEELSVNNQDTKNLASVYCVEYLELTSPKSLASLCVHDYFGQST